MTVWKRQDHGDSKMVSGCQGRGGGPVNRWSAEVI